MLTTFGIAKFTAAEVGAGGGVVAGGGTAAGGWVVVDWTVVGAEAAVVSVSEEPSQPARVPPARTMAGTATQTHGFFQPDLFWTGFLWGGLSS
jgi:hypothetical protein